MADAAYGSDNSAIAQFLSESSSFGNSPNSLQNILGQLSASAAPTIAGNELSAAAAGLQYGTEQAQFNLTSTNLEQQAANQLAQLGISNQQLGLSELGTEEQASLLGVTSGLEQQEYGLQQQQYPEQYGEALLNYTNNLQNLRGNLAATGAYQTIGAKQQVNTLGANWATTQQDINRAQQLSQLQQQGTVAQQNYSAQEIANQQANLKLVGQANGLSAQQVQQQLAYGLSQAGLDEKQALPQLLQELGGIFSGDLTAEGQSAAAAAMAAGINVIPSGLTG